MKPVIAISMGDVNGIGPEILIKALSHQEIRDLCIPVVFGSPRVFEEIRRSFPLCPPAIPVDTLLTDFSVVEGIPVYEGDFKAPSLRIGSLDAAAGKCAVEWVKMAVAAIQHGYASAIVTCPINKEGIHKAGYAYSGHTELIADLTHTQDYRMCLFTDTMRIVHITSHMSLKKAIAEVKQERIITSIQMGYDSLLKLQTPQKRIAVAALNPHAGEAGAFGDEEIREILPAIEYCQKLGIPCSGPYPPDTIFSRMQQGEFDMVISMYHDQGHIPLKLIAMDEGVNVTLGLPIVRTSVDHGTAYNIAGKGTAREDSLCQAIRLAVRMAGV